MTNRERAVAIARDSGIYATDLIAAITATLDDAEARGRAAVDDDRATLLAENAGLRGLLARGRPLATALAEALAGPAEPGDHPRCPHCHRWECRGGCLLQPTTADVARLVEAARRVMDERWNTVLTTPWGRDPAMRLDIALKAMDDALAPWRPTEER